MSSSPGRMGGGRKYSQSLSSTLNDPSGVSSNDSYFSSVAAVAEAAVGATKVAGSTANDPSIDATVDSSAFIRSHGSQMDIFAANHPLAQGDGSRESKLVIPSSTPIEGASLDSVMEAVPAVFFHDNFDLSDPECFATAVGDGDIDIVQDKLGNCLDMVEQALLAQIHRRSRDLFSALSDIRSLEADVGKARTECKGLRSDLALLHERTVVNSARVAHRVRRRGSMAALLGRAVMAHAVRSTPQAIQLMLSGSDFSGALDIISNTQGVADSQLRGFSALSDTVDQMEGLKSSVLRMMCTEFVQLARGRPGVLDSRESLRTRPDGDGEAASPVPSPGGLSGSVRRSLLELIEGIHRAGGWEDVMKEYKQALFGDIKGGVRSVLLSDLPSMLTDAAAGAGVTARVDSSSSLADRLRSLAPPAFCVLISSIYGTLLPILSRAREVHACVAAVGEAGAGSGLVGASFSVLVCTVEAAHTRCAPLLNVRRELIGRASLSEFADQFDATVSFVMSSEEYLDGEKVGALRSVALSSARTFVHSFAGAAVEKVKAMLAVERWEESSVPQQLQASADVLASGGSVVSSAQTSNTDGGSAACVRFCGESYRTAGSVLVVLKVVRDLVEVAQRLPLMSTDVCGRLTSLLDTLNREIAALVIGAGAVKSAGLRSVSSRHLAVASQSVGLLSALPAVCIAWLRPLMGVTSNSTKEEQETESHATSSAASRHAAALEELARSGRELKEHQVMGSRIDLHWHNRSTVQQYSRDPMVKLCREVRSLHGENRIAQLCKRFLRDMLPGKLAPLLPPQQLRRVFAGVCATFDAKLPEIWSSCPPSASADVLADIQVPRFSTPAWSLRGVVIAFVGCVVEDVVTGFVQDPPTDALMDFHRAAFGRLLRRRSLPASAVEADAGTDRARPLYGQSTVKEKTDDAGKGWFGMRRGGSSKEEKQALHAIRNRHVIDPKRHYRRLGWSKDPTHFEIGTVVEGNAEWFSARMTRRERRQTIGEEALAEAQASGWAKRKFHELQDRSAKIAKHNMRKKGPKRKKRR